MGQEIVYCWKCRTRLTAADFEKAGAIRAGDNASCSKCASQLLATLTPAERAALQAKPGGEPRKGSSPRNEAVRPPQRGGKPGSTSKIPRPPGMMKPGSTYTHAAGYQPAARKSNTGLIVGLIVTGIIGVIILIVVLASSGSPPADQTPSSTSKESAANKPPTAPAAPSSKITPAPPPVSGEMTELEALDQSIRSAIIREDFKQALALVSDAARRKDAPAWQKEMGVREKRIFDKLAELYLPLKERAAEAKNRNATSELKKIREQIVRWGIPDHLADFDRLYPMDLTPAAPTANPSPPAATPPPTPAAPQESEDYRKRWEPATIRAAVHEYSSAITDLERAAGSLKSDVLVKENAADVERVRAAMGAYAEILRTVSQLPKGDKVSLVVADETGKQDPVSGTVGNVSLESLEVTKEGDKYPVLVFVKDIAAASLVNLARARRGNQPEIEAHALALLCLLDGDDIAARAILPGQSNLIPQKYWDLSRNVRSKTPKIDSIAAKNEAGARKLFEEAEVEFGAIETRAAAIEKYLKLLGDYADTSFVRRHKAAIAPKTEGGKEYMLPAAELKGTGTFLLGKWESKTDRIGACWISKSELPPAGSALKNYVEIAFIAMPDTAYKGWVYAGGCCADTLSFYLQGTEFSDVNKEKKTVPCEPGSTHAFYWKHGIKGLRSTHASHGGAKAAREPDRWGWGVLPLPKYATPGLKVVRMLTEQKGCGVAFAIISSTRAAPPTDKETQEMLKPAAEAAVEVKPGEAPPSAPQALGGKTTSLNLGNNVKLELVLIPAGKFKMGSPPNEAGRKDTENPQHEVTISKPFYLGKYEVTQEQYEALMGTNPSEFKGAKNPVERVNWADAQEFCKKMSSKTGKTARLPSEAEWEYACRAGTGTKYSFGDSEATLGDYAWFKDNANKTTHPVGQKKPNAWGLYDMHGNVMEWCQDWKSNYTAAPITDPTGDASGVHRLTRGGSWLYDALGCRAAFRNLDWFPDFRHGNLGFRVAVTVSP